jgi:hypothetical protein
MFAIASLLLRIFFVSVLHRGGFRKPPCSAEAWYAILINGALTKRETA